MNTKPNTVVRLVHYESLDETSIPNTMQKILDYSAICSLSNIVFIFPYTSFSTQ